MSTGLIDEDCLLNKKDFFYDLDIMKLGAYYKSKNEVTKLLLNPKEYIQYTKTYFIKNRFSYKMFDKIFIDPRLIYRGYAFAPDGYNPLPEDIENTIPEPSIYDSYLHFNNKIPATRLQKLSALKEHCHTRLSTNGEVCNIQTEKIYYKEANAICFYDYNVFNLTGWKDYLNYFKKKNYLFRFPPMTPNFEEVKYVLTNYNTRREEHFIIENTVNEEEIKEIITLGLEYGDRIKISILKGINLKEKEEAHIKIVDAMNTLLRLKQRKARVHAYISPHDININTVFLNNIAYWSNRNHGDVSLYTYIHNIRQRCEDKFDNLAEKDDVFNYLYKVIPSKWEKAY